MEEWISKLKEHLAEERKDIDSYLELSKKAESEGYHEVAGVLKDISCDEESHATAIEFLIEMIE